MRTLAWTIAMWYNINEWFLVMFVQRLDNEFFSKRDYKMHWIEVEVR